MNKGLKKKICAIAMQNVWINVQK